MFFLVTCRTPRLLNLGEGGGVRDLADSSFFLRHPPHPTAGAQHSPTSSRKLFWFSLGALGSGANLSFSPWSDAKFREVGWGLGLAGNEGACHWGQGWETPTGQSYPWAPQTRRRPPVPSTACPPGCGHEHEVGHCALPGPPQSWLVPRSYRSRRGEGCQ